VDLLSRLALNASRGLRTPGPVPFTQIVRKPKKVLCLPAQQDGELLLALPAIRSLRRHYRESLLSLLLDDARRHLWRFDDEVDEVIEYRPDLVRGVASPEFKRVREVLRARRFDLVIDLGYQPHRLMAFLLSQGQPKVSAGMEHRETDKFRNLVIRDRSLPSDEVHRNLGILKVLGIDLEGHAMIWPKLADSEGRREFRERLRDEGLKRNQAILAIDAKPWERRDLDEFIGLMAAEPSIKLMLLNVDAGAGLSVPAQSLVMESPSMTELAEALSCVQGFVGAKNDTFSVANLLRVPSVIAVREGTRGLPAASGALAIVAQKGAVRFPRQQAQQLAADMVQKITTKIY